MTDDELIKAMHDAVNETHGCELLGLEKYDGLRTAYAIARQEIERRALEELMEPTPEMREACQQNFIRSGGRIREPWQAMLRASPLYARVHGSEKGKG